MVEEGKPSLLEEFRTTTHRTTKCTVCHSVPPEVREVVEDGLNRGVGAVAMANWLRKKGLWTMSHMPILTHARHFKRGDPGPIPTVPQTSGR